MEKILDCEKMVEEIYSQIPNMKEQELAIITIGDDDASKVYVRNKIKACEKVGLIGRNYTFRKNSMKSDVVNCIRRLNYYSNVVGIMVQKPYPSNFDGIEDFIDFEKDVDGLNFDNMYQTLIGDEPFFYPATPLGIITLLDYYHIPIEGKNVVIIGRSDIVGKPLAAMMSARNATVTLCHSKTKNLIEHTRNADIIVSAVGKAKFINSTYITDEYYTKDGCHKKSIKFPTIIDVGINRDENGKLCGDVDFDDVLPYVSHITRVPRGIGLTTVCMLIYNCCKNNIKNFLHSNK